MVLVDSPAYDGAPELVRACKLKIQSLLQVTVALMEKMEVLDGSPQQVAQDFAVQLFNAWGVGDAGCQNGLLLFLSKQDRQVLHLHDYLQ